MRTSASCARTWTTSCWATTSSTRRSSLRCARTWTGAASTSWTEDEGDTGSPHGIRRFTREDRHPRRAVGVHARPQEVVAGPDRGHARPPRAARGLHPGLRGGAIHLHAVLGRVRERVLTRRAAEGGGARGGRRLRPPLLLAVSLSAGPLAAQGLRELSPERLAAEPPLAGALPTDIAWHPDGKRLTYLRHRDGATDLCALDAASGRESVLLAGSKVRATNGAEDKPLPLTGYAWSPSGDSLLVAARGDVFLVDAGSGAVRPLVRTPETEEYP